MISLCNYENCSEWYDYENVYGVYCKKCWMVVKNYYKNVGYIKVKRKTDSLNNIYIIQSEGKV